MRMLADTLVAVLTLSSTLVFGEPHQFGTPISLLNADQAAPTVSAALPNQPSARIPPTQRPHRIWCEVKFKSDVRGTSDFKVYLPIPNERMTLTGRPHIKDCASIESTCPSLVVAVPTPEGGICCQNGKNQLHLCAGLDLRFLTEPKSGFRLITMPDSTDGALPNNE
jgi:hypothetical protein